MSINYKKLIYTAENNNSQTIDHYVRVLQQALVEETIRFYGMDIETSFRHSIISAMDNLTDEDPAKAKAVNDRFVAEGPNALVTDPDINLYENMRPTLEKAFTNIYTAMNVKEEIDNTMAGMKEQYPNDYTDEDLKEIKFGLLERLPEGLGAAANSVMYMLIFKGEEGELDSGFKASIDGLISNIINAAVTHRPNTPNTFEELMAIPMNPEVKDIQASVKTATYSSEDYVMMFREFDDKQRLSLARYIQIPINMLTDFIEQSLFDSRGSDFKRRVLNKILKISESDKIRAYVRGLNNKTVLAISIEDAKTQVKFMVPTLKSVFNDSDNLPADKIGLIDILAEKYMADRGIDLSDLNAHDTATQIARVFVGIYSEKINEMIAEQKKNKE